jgi:hypothetical protein
MSKPTTGTHHDETGLTIETSTTVTPHEHTDDGPTDDGEEGDADGAVDPT